MTSASQELEKDGLQNSQKNKKSGSQKSLKDLEKEGSQTLDDQSSQESVKAGLQSLQSLGSQDLFADPSQTDDEESQDGEQRSQSLPEDVTPEKKRKTETAEKKETGLSPKLGK